MRYFFHISYGANIIRDGKGADYASLTSDGFNTLILARELRRKEGWGGFSIVVATAREKEVLRVLVVNQPLMH
jgi:hypothetical protein